MIKGDNNRAYNNYAPVLTGQMHHEIRRAKKVLLPPSDLSHNQGAEDYELMDARNLEFRKKPPPVLDFPSRDFRPAQA